MEMVRGGMMKWQYMAGLAGPAFGCGRSRGRRCSDVVVCPARWEVVVGQSRWIGALATLTGTDADLCRSKVVVMQISYFF